MRGQAGKTHCGRWTNRVPRGCLASRLVYTRSARHTGQHWNRYYKVGWSDR